AVPYYNAGYWPEGNAAIYNDYVEGMAKNLDNLAAQHDVELTFFATKFPQDADVTKDIQQKMTHKDKTTIIDDNLLPERILDITA
ncbi:polysaccharide pyruvyl transferase, partial [Staphylococcus aureus]|nr:polysaccharide pyruvyl transferase [Staphylococcus aureus]